MGRNRARAKATRDSQHAAFTEEKSRRAAKQAAQDALAKRQKAAERTKPKRTEPVVFDSGLQAPGHARLFEPGEKDYDEKPPKPRGFDG